MNDPRSFLDVLRELDKGAVNDRLGEALQELVEACAATGKKGDLTLKLSVDPKSTEDAEHCAVSASVKLAKPGPSLRASLFFIDDAKNLTRRDPRQGDLEEHVGPRAADTPS